MYVNVFEKGEPTLNVNYYKRKKNTHRWESLTLLSLHSSSELAHDHGTVSASVLRKKIWQMACVHYIYVYVHIYFTPKQAQLLLGDLICWE